MLNTIIRKFCYTNYYYENFIILNNVKSLYSINDSNILFYAECTVHIYMLKI